MNDNNIEIEVILNGNYLEINDLIINILNSSSYPQKIN